MLHVTEESGQTTIKTERYQLSLPKDRPFVFLHDQDGNRLAELFVLSSVNPLQGRDACTGISDWEIDESGDELLLSLAVTSNVWREKLIRFRCQPERFSYEVKVTGKGKLAEYHPFGGYSSAIVRWGSGFYFSGQAFQQGFNPEPNMAERNHFAPAEGSSIDLMGVPAPGMGGWFFTPPPFCFAFQVNQGWLGIGAAAEPGQNRFTAFRYAGQHQAFHMTLEFEGHTEVDGEYQLPAITFDFGDDEYDAVRKHADYLRRIGYAPAAAVSTQPDWWHEPIFCGWGSQCYAASTEKGRAPDYARQALYDGFLANLTGNGINPGIVVLDDKWQSAYGINEVDESKWPDLPGFVRDQHAQGRKVLLWLKAWDPEGLPAEECVRNSAGLPIAFDPSNPAFEARLRAAVRRMVSADGYDADGFKLDFTARIPSGPGIETHGDVWGLELMKLYLHILNDEAKRVKPDALIMAHTPHPYLADVVDMIRLNDINTGKDVNKAMNHRAQIAGIACPEAIIDTDNWPITDRAAWRRYLPLQASLGVPSLYYASHIDSTGEPLEDEDYQLVRDIWDAHRAKRGS